MDCFGRKKLRLIAEEIRYYSYSLFSYYFLPDNTYPILTCPISQTIEFTNENDQRFVDFSTLGYSVTDLNIIASPVFSLESYTFTSADLEQTREVVLTVTDAAGFQSSCRFQYLVLGQYSFSLHKMFRLCQSLNIIATYSRTLMAQTPSKP